MRVIVPLTDEEFDRLQELSIEEWRPLRDQAGYLLSKALAETSKVEVKSVSRGGHDAETD